MDERIMIGVGIVLIIVGIAAAIIAGPMQFDAQVMAAMEDQLDEARSLRVRADIIRYGGLGLGAIGVVIMTAGLIKDQASAYNRM